MRKGGLSTRTILDLMRAGDVQAAKGNLLSPRMAAEMMHCSALPDKRLLELYRCLTPRPQLSAGHPLNSAPSRAHASDSRQCDISRFQVFQSS
ncbi:hypothetical protein K474DRAFT_1336782 [Panus rudis PR-1116 ss-1]|nr:hypothetical protein K474DRAFT_1336782 [Panus rudis PR-1116 ss-1]